MQEGSDARRVVDDELDAAALPSPLRSLLEHSQELLTVLDSATDPPRVVAASARMLDARARAMVGDVLGETTPLEVQAYLWQVVRRAVAEGTQQFDGHWSDDRTGRSTSFASVWHPVAGGPGEAPRYVLAQVLDLLAASRGGDTAVLEAVLAATSAERRRIAQHIHDDTVQVLSALTLELELLRRRVDPDGEHGVGRLRDRLQHANQRVRDVVTDLDPSSVATVAVGDAVRDRMQSAAAMAGVELVVHDGVTGPLAAPVAEALYWIATEAVGNAIRHAGADRVTVTMARRDGSISLSVVDRGRGFVTGAVPADRFGLRSMRARAQRLGGTLGVSSTPTGTTIAATLPLSQDEEAGTGVAPPLAEDIATALRHLDTDLEAAWTAAPVGIVLVDRQGLISRANPAAAALLGRPVDRLVGQPLAALPGSSTLAEEGAAVRSGDRVAARGVLPGADADAAGLRFRLSRVGAPAGPPWLSVLTIDRID